MAAVAYHLNTKGLQAYSYSASVCVFEIFPVKQPRAGKRELHPSVHCQPVNSKRFLWVFFDRDV